MDIKWFKQCWRVALKAYDHYVNQQPEHIEIASSFIPALVRLDRNARTIHKFSDKLNTLPKHISAQYLNSFNKALSNVKSSVVESDWVIPDKKLWVSNFVWGLYQLASKEAVKINFKDDAHITFAVEDVVIEDVELGDFKVKVSLIDPCDITIWSLTHEGFPIPHPHIRDSNPCLGDAKAILMNAWDGGDTASVRDILDAYLRSYNSGSAYVEIGNIFGYSCKDCGQQCSEMDICEGCDEPSCCQVRCHQCDESYYRCEQCVSLSECNSCAQMICNDCCSTCASCGNTLCEKCSSMCDECEKNFCESCMTDNSCNMCLLEAQKASEEEKANVATE